MKPKQVLFILGLSLQIVIFGFTLFYLHNAYEKTDVLTIFDERIEKDELEGETSAANLDISLPFSHYVVADGTVACSKYMTICPKVDGVVDEVFVKEGDLISSSEALFHLDETPFELALEAKCAEYDTALAKLKFLEKEPSRFELRAKEKEIENVRMQCEQAEKEREVFESLYQKCAVSKLEKQQQEENHRIAKLQMEKAMNEYEQIKEGATQEEREIKKAELNEKEMSVKVIERQLQECTVKSSTKGRILSIDVKKGSYVSSKESKGILIGSEDPMHLHVRVGEKAAWRINPKEKLKAIAIHTANPKLRFPLKFISMKPSFEKTNHEEGKLHMIFSFDKGHTPIYLDQNLTVYIEATSEKDTDCLDYQFERMFE